MMTLNDAKTLDKLSDHFKLSEATYSATAIAKKISNSPTDQQIMNMIEAADHLEAVRSFLGYPMHIDSWIRVAALNLAVGGVAHSAHMDGWAIDFTCPQYGTPLQIAQALVKSNIKFDQLISEGNWCHISFGGSMRQEVLTAHFVPGKPTSYTSGV